MRHSMGLIKQAATTIFFFFFFQCGHTVFSPINTRLGAPAIFYCSPLDPFGWGFVFGLWVVAFSVEIGRRWSIIKSVKISLGSFVTSTEAYSSISWESELK